VNKIVFDRCSGRTRLLLLAVKGIYCRPIFASCEGPTGPLSCTVKDLICRTLSYTVRGPLYYLCQGVPKEQLLKVGRKIDVKSFITFWKS
jgi:hypothetical protein